MTRIIHLKKQILTGQRGAVLILVGILLVLILGFGALAVDLGYSYVIKSELQNAADAAALAGASVLFTDNENCLSGGSPYSCCSGSKTGSCNPALIDDNNVVMTARAVAARNYSSGGNVVPTPTIEIGHYKFASSWGSPGDFYPTTSYSQMSDWPSHTFSDLNNCDGLGGRPFFINAVRATVTRTDVPRFFSRIWGSSDLAVSAHATAYVGFAGTLPPGAVDVPIAICKQSIITDPNCTENCQFTCVNGRMINSGGGVTTNTGAWTNFTQPCTTANPSNMPSACTGESPLLTFGEGMGTVGGQQNPVWNSVIDCWKKKCASAPVTDPVNCTQPWKMTLPVIECPSNNPGPCSKLVGAVEIYLLWLWGQNPDMEQGPVNMTVRNPETGDVVKTWSRPSSCTALSACHGANDRSNCRGNCSWNSFVDTFGVLNAGGTPPKIGPSPQLKPSDLERTMYFLPDCKEKAAQGGTGGENYGILARYPVLVKCRGG